MSETKTIKILVSCPNDVTPEKEQIIRMCKDFSDVNHGRSDLAFTVLDWRDYVGHCGTRGQQQLKDYFGVYDIYIGLLWKRFGTSPGSRNSNGQENESGTEEEFYDAIDYQKIFELPKIYFFIKTYDRSIHSLPENEQFGKVLKFIENQKSSNNNYLNYFDSNDAFQSSILKLLVATQFDYEIKDLAETRKKYLSEETKLKIELFRNGAPITPHNYITRTTTHFTIVKDKLANPYLEFEQQSLDKLLISTKRIVLLGDAGSGKSTELSNLAYRLRGENSPFVPILQNLNSYTPELGLEKYLPEFWMEVPANLLIIIWDGLDEIEPKNFNTVVRQINTFAERHAEVHILISCRTNFYELPVNDATGTLPSFEPYLINDLKINEVKDYYSREYSALKSENFIAEVFNANLSDLVAKPFFLMLLANQFNHDKTLQLNRSTLYENFILSRVELDQNHFKTTINLRSKKQEILLLLQKVALGMETLSKNQITEGEILTLISSDDFDSLKYCTAFKKSDGMEETWQFEHNNIQEYLAAKALSNLDFSKVIQFIAFAPHHNKLVPSWVNTLAFLFNILDSNSSLFEKLLQWMMNNEKEVMVKFEPDKVPEDLRVQIFQGIFNYYRLYDVWISSNKFSDRELSRFGQSEKNLRFLIEEIKNSSNSRTVRINAIRLIGHFQIDNFNLKADIERLLFKEIDQNIQDSNYVHTVIYALKWAGFLDANTINELMEKLGNKKNQYIRAAMYSILLKSNVLDNYVSYLIEGYELTDKIISGQRDDVNLMDEEWNLKECLKSIKSTKGIKEIVEYISESTKFEYGYDSNKVIEAIVLNAVYAYKEDSSILNSFLKWFRKNIRGYQMEKTNLILQFFEKTNTRELAFHEIWESNEVLKERDKSMAIAKLLNPELMLFVIDEYLKRNITNKELEWIYIDIGWVHNEFRDQLEKMIYEGTGFEIKISEPFDYESLRKKKLKVDFNLLFDQQAFKQSTLEVFNHEQKEELSSDELFEMRKVNDRWLDIDEYYPSVALSLLRDFVSEGRPVRREKVLKWFDKDANEEWYRVSLIYKYLTNHKELEVTSEQIEWIKRWCFDNVLKVNFKKAITVSDDGRVSFKSMAMYIWYFSNRFAIDHPKSVLLDMLSFDFFEGHEWVGIDYIISKLNYKDILDRMLENIMEGIADISVLKNHVKFLSKNQVKDSYVFILNEIINLKRSDYQRRDLLDLFFDHSKDIEGIKSIIEYADTTIRWALIDKLKMNNQESFVEKYLLNILEVSQDNEEIGKASEVLVGLQNMVGLKAYVEWIKNNAENNIDLGRAITLSNLRSIEAIPYLIELLEIAYVREIKVDRFDRFNAMVIGAFSNIALVSEDNFNQVKFSLQQFMSDKASSNDSIKYILHTIERMENQFYMNAAQSFSLKQVKEKLELLEQ